MHIFHRPFHFIFHIQFACVHICIYVCTYGYGYMYVRNNGYLTHAPTYLYVFIINAAVSCKFVVGIAFAATIILAASDGQ